MCEYHTGTQRSNDREGAENISVTHEGLVYKGALVLVLQLPCTSETISKLTERTNISQKTKCFKKQKQRHEICLATLNNKTLSAA